MAGEFCNAGCGWCGRCEVDYEPPCEYCGHHDCGGQCVEYFETIEDEARDHGYDECDVDDDAA